MKRFLSTVVFLLAAFAASAQRYAVTDYSVVYLRADADYESALETQELMGTVVEILAEKDYWRKVSVPQPYVAWCTDHSLVEMTEDEMKDYLEAPKYICTSLFSKVYSEPSDKSEIVSDLVLGDVLRIVYKDEKLAKPQKKGRFLAAMLPSGKVGYVPSKDIEEQAKWSEDVSDATGEDIVATAKRFLGTPYLWGGMSSKGLDCSGLVRLSYMMNGIYLPRNAREMIEKVTEVSMEIPRLRPGDLLFFGTPAKGLFQKEKITHVGMYIGDGRFIHSSHIVRINSMKKEDEDCYENIDRLLHAGRVIRL